MRQHQATWETYNVSCFSIPVQKILKVHQLTLLLHTSTARFQTVRRYMLEVVASYRLDQVKEENKGISSDVLNWLEDVEEKGFEWKSADGWQ